MQPYRFLICIVALAACLGFAQSIEEKKQTLSHGQESGHHLPEGQPQLVEIRAQLEDIYAQAAVLRSKDAPASAYAPLYEKAKELHIQWQQQADELIRSSSSSASEAIWHLPEATVRQIVIDFGGSDAIYLIPEEIAQRKVAVVSSLSLPRHSWSSMLELMLSQMGIGVRQINPFCRELFAAGLVEGFDYITDRRDDLWLIPDEKRVCFVIGPGPVDIKQFARSLSRLIDPSSTQVKPIGSQLALIAPALRVRQLLQIYDFMARTEQTKAYRIISLSRLSADDLQKMLAVIFAQSSDNSSANKADLDAIGLQVFPILYDQRSALFVAGSEAEVKRAVDLIGELENQIEMSSGKRLFWYSAKHANAEDLAKVISKVYRMLVQATGPSDTSSNLTEEMKVTSDKENAAIPGNVSPLVVSPTPVTGGHFDDAVTGVQTDGQIVVDSKSGALIMVVEPAVLPKLKELLGRLDTPKKMVRVDFLLFEKKITDQTQFGLEQLKLGAAASKTNVTGFGFSEGLLTNPSPVNPVKGIAHFFASRKRNHGIPSFDLAYNFLLSQESIQINANPSVITLNGTPSIVNLVDEISLSTGPTQWQDEQGKAVLKDSYTRAQYGITLKVTPTIHQSEQEGRERTVSLETDITFDTPSSLSDARPSVTRRNIKNLVKVADGQTVVLGGLRQKQTDDTQMALPFLGEIPGFGKLFSYSTSTDITKEMFIFITPHVIDESEDELRKLQLLEMKARPGDINEFLMAYEQSRAERKRMVFARSLQAIFGRSEQLHVTEMPKQHRGEYDGRS